MKVVSFLYNALVVARDIAKVGIPILEMMLQKDINKDGVIGNVNANTGAGAGSTGAVNK